MKKQALQENRSLSIEQLVKEIEKKKSELTRVKLDMRMGTVKNVHVVRTLRREIAQLKTLAKERGKEE